jgi:hypothetical protein
MTKKCTALLGALLLSIALFASSNPASAHWAYSPYNIISTSPFYHFHTPTPYYATYTYVGYNSSGAWQNTTSTVAASPSASYWIQAFNYCTNGGYTWSNAVYGGEGTTATAPTCESWGGASAHLSLGACGIAP